MAMAAAEALVDLLHYIDSLEPATIIVASGFESDTNARACGVRKAFIFARDMSDRDPRAIECIIVRRVE